jgi:hypothetical protein
MTPEQRELARHALGFPNKKNESYRNHFCSGRDCDHYAEWVAMVEQGYAIELPTPKWSNPNDAFFSLTLKGALLARDAKEHLSPEDAREMRGAQ